MIIGYVWYSLPVFGRSWMQLIGKTEEDLKKNSGSAMGLTVPLSFLMAFVLAHFLSYAQADTLGEALVTSLWLWFGLVFAVIMMQNLFAQRSFRLTLINSGYHLVQLLAFATILVSWK